MKSNSKHSVIYISGKRSAGKCLQGARWRQPLLGLSKQGNKADRSPRKLSRNIDHQMLTSNKRLHINSPSAFYWWL